MRTIKSIAALLLIGSISSGLLSGCGAADTGSAASASDSDNTLSFTVVTKQLKMDYWEMVQAGARLAGQEEGIDIQITGPATEADVTDAADIINEAIETGTDGLIVAAADPEYLSSTLASAHDAGIPVIALDSPCPDENAYDAYVGTDNYAAGETLGKYIAEQEPDAQVAIIRGVEGSNVHDERENGITSGLSDGNLTVAAVEAANSDIETAINKTEMILSEYPDVSVIAATSDDMAIGVLAAVQAAGKEDEIAVYGFDGATNGLEALIADELTADCAQKPFDMGYQSVKLCKAVADGETVEKENYTGHEIITSGSAQAYYDSIMERIENIGSR